MTESDNITALCTCSPISGLQYDCPEHGADATIAWHEDEEMRLSVLHDYSEHVRKGLGL